MGDRSGKRAENYVDNALTRFGISRNDGRRILRVHDRSRPCNHFDIPETSAIERDVLFEQTREAVVNRRPRDGRRAIHAATDLVIAL